MYAYGFRIYFTPLTGVLFAFPSRYWFTIGQLGVFSLGGWSPHVQSGYHVSRPTRFHNLCLFVYGAITLYRQAFQLVPLKHKLLKGWSPFARRSTKGISVDFFSSGYLDVSVPRVRLLYLCIQYKIPVKGGFPHSEISGSKLICQLPEAYRRLLRPSSPSTA